MKRDADDRLQTLKSSIFEGGLCHLDWQLKSMEKLV
jgi:hypothetical protein